jgi:hypothetical protein
MNAIAQRDTIAARTRNSLGAATGEHASARGPSAVQRDNDAPGFHAIDLARLCRDPEHGIPLELHVPDGKKYVHYCPSCGHKSVAFGRMVQT